MPIEKAKGSPRDSRPTRMAAQLRQELAKIVGRELRDPRLEGLIIASVALTQDLRLAKVFFRLAVLTDTDAEREARQKDAKVALERAAGKLRTEVTTRLKLRFAPEFRFQYDAGQEARDRIDELLEEVKRDTGADKKK